MKPPSTPTSWDRVLQTVLYVFLWNLRRRKKVEKSWNVKQREKNFYLDCRLHFVNSCVTAKRFFMEHGNMFEHSTMFFNLLDESVFQYIFVWKSSGGGVPFNNKFVGHEEPTTKGKLEQIANVFRTTDIQSNFWYLRIDYFAKWNFWLDFLLSISVPNCKSHMYRKVVGNTSRIRD